MIVVRFFLTQQLIYNSKIKKHNVNLVIFVSETSIGRNLHLPGIGQKTFKLDKDPYFFWVLVWYLYCWSLFEDKGLIIDVKQCLH